MQFPQLLSLEIYMQFNPLNLPVQGMLNVSISSYVSISYLNFKLLNLKIYMQFKIPVKLASTGYVNHLSVQSLTRPLSNLTLELTFFVLKALDANGHGRLEEFQQEFLAFPIRFVETKQISINVQS